jgi:tRNA pseudouridine65 synthase
VPAVTEFRRLAVFERYALVEARPLTGRRHQIRRHFKHISHPLIGDVRYGKGEHNRLFRERFGLHRLALHALELAFVHPETEEELRIVAPVPEDLAGPLRAMGIEVPG